MLMGSAPTRPMKRVMSLARSVGRGCRARRSTSATAATPVARQRPATTIIKEGPTIRLVVLSRGPSAAVVRDHSGLWQRSTKCVQARYTMPSTRDTLRTSLRVPVSWNGAKNISQPQSLRLPSVEYGLGDVGNSSPATTAAISCSCARSRALKHPFAPPPTMSALGHKRT